MNEILSYLKINDIAGIPLFSYLISCLVIIFSLIFSKIFSTFLVNNLLKITEKTKTDLDDMVIHVIKKPLALLIVIGGVLAANEMLQYPEDLLIVKNFINGSVKIAVTINIAWFFFRAVDSLTIYIEKFTIKTKTQLDDQMAGLLQKTLKVLIVLTSALLIFQNLGYSISGIVAGLGIGGLAIALAAKEFIANFFGFVTIILDNPFRIGDWVKFGETEGDVEDIGFRSTKIRGFDKTVYTVPNSNIANATIQNYQRMPKRRVKMFMGISYKSRTKDIEDSLNGIREYLRNNKNINQDFFLVNFRDFGESSLNIMLYYFTNTTVWKEYEDIREEVNLKVMNILESHNIEIIKPTVVSGNINFLKGQNIDPEKDLS